MRLPVTLATRLTVLCILSLGTSSCVSGHAAQRTDPLGSSTSLEGGATEFEVQSLVMGMADEYSGALGEAMYLLVRSENVDPKGRWLAQSFLRNGMGAAIDIAVGPNPSVGLLDLLVLGSLQSWAFEKHWIPAGIGEAAGRKALERLQEAESDLWQRGTRVLSPEQVATLRELVGHWIEAHPDRTVVSLVRFEDFTDQRRMPTLAAHEAASGLLADVKKATAAVEDAELLGERILWFAGRLPYVLGQQAELTAYRIADQPEAALIRDAATALEDLVALLTDRLRTLDADLSTQQVELFSRLRAERVEALEDLAEKAATIRRTSISEAFDRLGQERKAFFDDLEGRQRELGPMMGELRETIRASGELARDMTGTVEALDRVVGHFDRGPGDQRKPLEIKDVTEAAAEASRAAERLTALLDRADEILGSPFWETKIGRLDETTKGFVDYAFWRAVWLLVILLCGLAGLRLLPRRKA